MKNLRHTPGPYVFAGYKTAGHDLVGRQDWHGRLYTESERDDHGNRKVVVEGIAAEEDWRLFAVVPELLVKVRQLATVLRLLRNGETLNCSDFDQLEVDTLAILAKAEGKQCPTCKGNGEVPDPDGVTPKPCPVCK